MAEPDEREGHDQPVQLSYEPAPLSTTLSPAELLLAAFIGFITMIAAGGLLNVMFSPSVATTPGPTTAPAASPSAMVLASTFGSLAGLGATLLMLKTLHRDSFARIGLSTAHLKGAMKSVLLWIVIILPVTFLSMVFFSWLYQVLNLHTETEHPLLRMLTQFPQLLPLVVVSAVVLAPVFEELIFRGCIQTSLAMLLRNNLIARRWFPILISSGIFALVHGEFWMMPPLFVLAVGLGYSYTRTGRLWVPMAVHAAFNGVSIALFLAREAGLFT